MLRLNKFFYFQFPAYSCVNEVFLLDRTPKLSTCIFFKIQVQLQFSQFGLLISQSTFILLIMTISNNYLGGKNGENRVHDYLFDDLFSTQKVLSSMVQRCNLKNQAHHLNCTYVCTTSFIMSFFFCNFRVDHTFTNNFPNIIE